MLAILENQLPIVKFLGALVIAVGVALVGNYILFNILRRISKRSSLIPDGSVNRHCRGVVRVMLLLIAVRFVVPFVEMLGVDKKYVDTLLHIIGLLLIGSLSWFVIKLTQVLEDVIVSRFDVDAEDNLRARKIHTQLRVLRRIVIVVVGILALGTMLMTFEKIRQLGTTILASAGIIGIVVGMAAQRTIGTFCLLYTSPSPRDRS